MRETYNIDRRILCREVRSYSFPYNHSGLTILAVEPKNLLGFPYSSTEAFEISSLSGFVTVRALLECHG